jgi:hypothetical protein
MMIPAMVNFFHWRPLALLVPEGVVNQIWYLNLEG